MFERKFKGAATNNTSSSTAGKSAVQLKDNRTTTVQRQTNSSAPLQLATKHYWYRTSRRGAWHKAGTFGSHAAANVWLKANRAAMGIVGFGQGGKKTYR